jgi:hypothetical protein
MIPHFRVWEVDDFLRSKVDDICRKINTIVSPIRISAFEVAINIDDDKAAYLFSKTDNSYRTIVSDFFQKENHSLLFSPNLKNEFENHFLGESKIENLEVFASLVTFKGVKTKSTVFTNWVDYLKANNYNGHVLWIQNTFPFSREEGEYDSIDYKVGFFILLTEEANQDKIAAIHRFVRSEALKNSILPMMLKRQLSSLKDLDHQATKAAISEILNRNIAHHLTSHVSPRATLDKVLERLGCKADKEKAAHLSNISNYTNILQLLNRFNTYRDERSEFLTYAINVASPTTNLLLQDIIRPFIENTLLMDNIAANENLNFKVEEGKLTSNKLQIGVFQQNKDGSLEELIGVYFYNDGNVVFDTHNLPYEPVAYEKLMWYRESQLKRNLYNYFKPKTANEQPIPDFEVSVPGTLGKHALYSMLENFIRNSAKHGNAEMKKEGLKIQIILRPNPDDADKFHFTITDNCSLLKSEDKDGKVKEIKLEDFNAKINSKILDKKDLGMIDMKVNACLLRGAELTDDNCKENSLQAVDYDGKLAYNFYIAKPKKAVFIGCEDNERNNGKGFFFFPTVNDFIKSPISKSFRFAVVSKKLFEAQKGTDKDGNALRPEIEVIRHKLPARLLKCTEVIDKTKQEDLWLKKLNGEAAEQPKVHVYFQEEEDEYLTHKYKNELTGKSISVYAKEESPDTSTTNHVLYDRHGEILGFFNDEDFSLVPDTFSWIVIDKNNTDYDYLKQYDFEASGATTLQAELEEAGRLNILVIDERVAEESVRDLSTETEYKEDKTGKRGFEKKDGDTHITLFDVAWAANVKLATHLNGTPLKQEIDLATQHALHVDFTNGEMELKSSLIPIGKEMDELMQVTDELTKVESKIDTLIIHRTKLKDLTDKDKTFIQKLFEKQPDLNLIVTTGSGATHGIDGHFKVLPFSTLKELILGKRIQKMKLSKTLLELTNNNV